MVKLKLTVELVPSSVWFSSVYRILRRKNRLKEWYKIKSRVFEEEGHQCYICGSKRGPFSAHEFWEYDDEKHVQRLNAIHHLCALCHKIKHIGFWCYTSDGKEKLRKSGLTKKVLVDHFCKVNNCSEKQFKEHEDRAFKIWRERSRHEWKQDFGKYKIYLE